MKLHKKRFVSEKSKIGIKDEKIAWRLGVCNTLILLNTTIPIPFHTVTNHSLHLIFHQKPKPNNTKISKSTLN
jgi:hypothetical protein